MTKPSNRILDAYITEANTRMYSDFEQEAYNLLQHHTLAELETLGKVMGERIQAALDDAYPVATKSAKDSFKKAFTKGLK